MFKESLRLHPIIYEVARRITEPVEVGGYRIPAGATVMPAIGLVQSDGRQHPEPERFDPGRFVGGQPPANTWIPFGGGARRCLGAAFSQLEATIVLRQVLTRFDLAADRRSAERPKPRNITLAPGAAPPSGCRHGSADSTAGRSAARSSAAGAGCRRIITTVRSSTAWVGTRSIRWRASTVPAVLGGQQLDARP